MTKGFAQLLRVALIEAATQPPVAFYHKQIDTLVALIRDCPRARTFTVDQLTILTVGCDQDKELVGMYLRDAASFCETHGLIADGQINLETFFRTVLLEIPGFAEEMVILAETFRERPPVPIA